MASHTAKRCCVLMFDFLISWSLCWYDYKMNLVTFYMQNNGALVTFFFWLIFCPLNVCSSVLYIWDVLANILSQVQSFIIFFLPNYTVHAFLLSLKHICKLRKSISYIFSLLHCEILQNNGAWLISLIILVLPLSLLFSTLLPFEGLIGGKEILFHRF